MAYVVMRQTQSLPGPNAYRILFGVQWIFAAISLAILPFFVESPYHLVAQGRDEKARINIRKLYGRNADAESMLASIKADLENASKTMNAASFGDCFRGTNAQRTLIAMSTFVVQAVCGISWIIGYMAYFLILGGMSDARAFDATVGLSFIMLVGNMCGWIFIEKFGRRGTALWGKSFPIDVRKVVQLMISSFRLNNPYFHAFYDRYRVGPSGHRSYLGAGRLHGNVVVYVPSNNWIGVMAHNYRGFDLFSTRAYTVACHHYERCRRCSIWSSPSICRESRSGQYGRPYCLYLWRVLEFLLHLDLDVLPGDERKVVRRN